MPKKSVFCDRAGTDISEITTKSKKTDKNEHENGKCQIPKPGRSNSQSLSSKSQIQPWRFIKLQE